MKSFFSYLIREWMPPRLRKFAQRWRTQPRYGGNFRSWEKARAASAGYETPEIFEKVLGAARAVRDGRALWERDSVTFNEPAVHWPLLAALLRVAAAENGRLRVADFGGAFGSTWWQHRDWFDGLAEVRWCVIEQPHLAEAGRREFAMEPLRFYNSLNDCHEKEQPHVILLSSVLPYLEKPHDLLENIARLRFRHVIIDRTGFVIAGPDRLTVQHVPATIYKASYPCWFFEHAGLLRSLGSQYRIIAEWRNSDMANIPAKFHGLALMRIQP